ncbi:MAG: hypothetical protein KJ726_10185 [Verrucomicrobia bacterium]|nr:hypothetical protein [Verrucomicrobiota bacterium]MBU1910404.1 hypothetical protein [Verrucomicrobiota bacterium]
MKTLRVLSGLLLFLVLVALAGGMIYLALSADAWHQALDALSGERLIALGAGVALLCLVLLYGMAGIKPRRFAEPFITFENEGGAVSVSTRAIGEVVSRVGDEFAAVLGLESAIRPAGGSIEVGLDVKVRGGTQIPELCRMLQDRVRDTIRENLGLSEIRGVKVTVREIVSPARERRKPEEGAA